MMTRSTEHGRRTSESFAFDFRSREPGAPLDRLVASLWYARGTVPYARERIAPTGSAVAVFVLGDPILETPADGAGPTFTATRGFLLGPHIRPVVVAQTGETFAVGIVATLVGCEALFGVRPSDVRGRVVDLADAWPEAEPIRHDLLAAAGPEEMLDLVGDRLLAATGRHPVGFARCEAAVHMLEDEPGRPVGDIAAALDVSPGHLDREFLRIVGLSPRALARILRVRRLLARLEVHGDAARATLAGELGWYDRADLIRDVRRRTGRARTERAGGRRSTAPPDDAADAAGAVPEI